MKQVNKETICVQAGWNLFANTMKKQGIACTIVEPDISAEDLDAAFQPNTKAVFAESIANPALTVLDFDKFAAAAHRHGVPLIVDNTFPIPINCHPFELGADIVTHVADARTCVLHPASHTHRQMNDEQLKETGISPDLIRLSVGIENADDIIADLEQAMQYA